MSQAETWTVRRLLEWTTDFFQKKNIESPRLEAEILLSTALGLKRIELYTNFETEPQEPERIHFREFVKRRGAGEPVAYLVGFKEFYSISLKVDRNVLIPRPETEQLVLETLDLLKSMPPGTEGAVCDVGTGSGAIAVAVAKNWPKNMKGKITAVDLSEDALAVARENAESNDVTNRIDFYHSDLLDAVAGPFDIVVSNPPYVSQSEYDTLPVDVKNYEPKSALLAGPKGTEIIDRIITQAIEKLRSSGYLLIEGSPMIADTVASLLVDWNNVRILKDGAGFKRFVIAQK